MSEETCPLCDTYTETPPFQQHWICCESCTTWFHNHCLHLSLSETSKILRFHCAKCTIVHGPTEYKRTSGRKRTKIDYVALDAGEVETSMIEQHPHIKRFVEWSGESKGQVQELDGKQLTKAYALSTRLPAPVKIPCAKKQGLGLVIPKDYDVDTLVESMGEDAHIEVMDVLTQNGTKHSWKLSEWRDYFKNKQDRERIYNVLSLEISNCELGEKIKRPTYVEDVDLVDRVWPQDLEGRPIVQKYCLMGVQDSYTDFHLDFAGTSVYYTVIYGSKQFMFFPPTDHNLKKYVNWITDTSLSMQFLGDLGLENGLKVELMPGDVMIIPSGWIHAVYTPVDTLVIGGNFLTSFNIPEQLRIIDIEIRTKVGKKFKFPNFSKLMWLTAWRVLEGDIEVGETIDAKGCVELLEYLKAQVDRKERGVRESVPTKYIGNAKSFLKRFEDFVKKNVTVAEVKSEELKEIPTKRRRLNDKTNTLRSDIKTDTITK